MGSSGGRVGGQVGALTMDGIAFTKLQVNAHMDSRAAANAGYTDIEGEAGSAALTQADDEEGVDE